MFTRVAGFTCEDGVLLPPGFGSGPGWDSALNVNKKKRKKKVAFDEAWISRISHSEQLEDLIVAHVEGRR
jgi:hypothetical protein